MYLSYKRTANKEKTSFQGKQGIPDNERMCERCYCFPPYTVYGASIVERLAVWMSEGLVLADRGKAYADFGFSGRELSGFCLRSYSKAHKRGILPHDRPEGTRFLILRPNASHL